MVIYTQSAAVLIIFPIYLQAITIDQMLSIGGEGNASTNIPPMALYHRHPG